ncbi:MAG: hypothetical protein EPO68_09980 [Planctomycetota bacterium]|nr:MAG: hypothetical protein EPO68_09980 [Planctomycetota bacterium]
MGKPISERLYAETPKGRIYICCKGCIKDILADVDTAYRAAFPKDVVHENKRCPATGAEIGKEAVDVVLQGHQFRVRDAKAAEYARENSQVVLAKLLDPKLIDLANEVCPVAGTPVVKNAVVVIDGHLIRLSSPKVLEEIERDPAKVLAKAKLLRAQPVAPAK